jgi:hypothetical protein
MSGLFCFSGGELFRCLRCVFKYKREGVFPLPLPIEN